MTVLDMKKPDIRTPEYFVVRGDGQKVPLDAVFLVLQLDAEPEARCAAGMYANLIRDKDPQKAEGIMDAVRTLKASR